MTYEELLRAPVNIHAGRTLTWGITREVADLLHETATAESVTLETGSGRSTLVLLHAGVARHIAIQPSADEFEAIREFCRAEGIAIAALEPVVAKSQDYLPHATLPPLDIVLIDGAHAFPFPFIDWYFTAGALKAGGLLIVDDVQIATGTILADFLEAEAGWTKVARTRRFAAFHRGTQGLNPLSDWQGQPYLANSYPPSRVLLERDHPKGALERAAGRLLPWRFQESLRQRYGWLAAVVGGLTQPAVAQTAFLLADLTEMPAMAYCGSVFIMTSARTVAMCCCCCREARKGLRPADPRRRTTHIG